MTIGEIIAKFADSSPVQFVHECIEGATIINGSGSRGAKKGHAPYTRLQIATTQMTVDDVLYFSREFGGAESRKPKYIGVIVWIPMQDYEAATATNAVDPSAQPQER